MEKLQKTLDKENFDKISSYRQNLLKTRTELVDLMPLSQPFTLTIGLNNRCNFGCSFCPTGDIELTRKSVATGHMDEKVLEKVIEGAKSFKKKLKKVSLTGFGEPFLHKDFLNIIKKIKKNDIAEKISVTTNGSLLQRFDLEEVAKNLDMITFSIEHVHDEGYKKVTGNFSNFKRVLENVEKFYSAKKRVNPELKVHVKIIDLDLTTNERIKFLNDFKKISDTINIDYAQSFTHSDKHDFSQNSNKEQRTKDGFLRSKEKNLICSQLFMYLKVVFNGNVVACCADWKHELIIGNVLSETLDEIWNGKKLKELRLTHIHKTKDLIGPCKNCDWIKNTIPNDDMTKDREKLKQIYKY